MKTARCGWCACPRTASPPVPLPVPPAQLCVHFSPPRAEALTYLLAKPFARGLEKDRSPLVHSPSRGISPPLTWRWLLLRLCCLYSYWCHRRNRAAEILLIPADPFKRFYVGRANSAVLIPRWQSKSACFQINFNFHPAQFSSPAFTGPSQQRAQQHHNPRTKFQGSDTARPLPEWKWTGTTQLPAPRKARRRWENKKEGGNESSHSTSWSFDADFLAMAVLWNVNPFPSQGQFIGNWKENAYV